jgi:uncharacterized protein with FMN-binding domain
MHHKRLARSAIILSITTIAAPAATALAAEMGVRRANDRPPALIASDPGRSLFRVVADGQAFRDGAYTGPAIDTYYGWLQVRADIQGGRLVRVEVLRYPNDRRASIRINSEALPWLESEVIRVQNARVNGVTGATLSSEAYLRSLDGALASAGAV